MDVLDCVIDIVKLKSVLEPLRIRLIHVDDDIVVLNKPPGLRSVPGNQDTSTQPIKCRKRHHPSSTSTVSANGHEQWALAIESYRYVDVVDDSGADPVVQALHRLATSNSNLSSIPRNRSKFLNYVQRNKTMNKKDHLLTEKMYEQLQEKLRFLKQERPNATSLEESATGQLEILGLGSSAKPLHVVHRLDCATSGLLVVARTAEAASVLSQAWRERNTVKKKYLARVSRWPPYQQEGQASQSEGTIDLSLFRDESHKIKWKVDYDKKSGKPSTTLWKVLPDLSTESYVTLELQPITGRTHQLRIHCAAINSTGIIGDSLYGTHDTAMIRATSSTPYNTAAEVDGNGHLYLHAFELTIPHPRTKHKVTFRVEPEW